MKNKLAENMLRFGPKNLTESERINLKRLSEGPWPQEYEGTIPVQVINSSSGIDLFEKSPQTAVWDSGFSQYTLRIKEFEGKKLHPTMSDDELLKVFGGGKIDVHFTLEPNFPVFSPDSLTEGGNGEAWYSAPEPATSTDPGHPGSVTLKFIEVLKISEGKAYVDFKDRPYGRDIGFGVLIGERIM